MKIIVYTANIGNYDAPEIPLFMQQNPDIEFWYITTDTTYRSNDWNVKFVNDMPLTTEEPQRAARYFKLQPHKCLPPHDISIWFDSCLTLRIPDYKHFVEVNLLKPESDMVAYRHPRRTCLYEEGKVCASQGLDNSIRIKRQMERYKKAKFPVNFGLYDTGFIIRRNNALMQHFNDLWYRELQSGSKRDQLSHGYALWKTGIKISAFIGGARKGASPYLTKRRHLHQKGKVKNKIAKAKIASVDQKVANRRIAYKMRTRR